jgi:hypothetical protein
MEAELFAIGMPIAAVPAIVLSGDTNITDGALLVMVTVTPPCCEAPRNAKDETCKPDPTVTVGTDGMIAGVVTVTVRVPVAVMVRTPAGPVALTEVTPLPIASNASP